MTKSNYCPHCGARLIADDSVIATNPPIYSATCEKCGKTFESYSHIGFEKTFNIVNNDMWEYK